METTLCGALVRSGLIVGRRAVMRDATGAMSHDAAICPGRGPALSALAFPALKEKFAQRTRTVENSVQSPRTLMGAERSGVPEQNVGW